MATNNNLVNISLKVHPDFKKLIEEAAKQEDSLGLGNISEFIRKAIQAYINENSTQNIDLLFLYNLLANKFRLKAELTDIEKQRLEKIEGDISGKKA